MNFRRKVINLFRAIKINDSKNVRELLQKNPKLVNTSGGTGKKRKLTPLWKAMIMGHVEIVELLIREFGADPDEPCLNPNEFYYNFTFLQYAGCIEYSLQKEKVAEFLIQHGTKVNAFCKQELENPLKNALLYGKDVKFVELLLKNGANVESVNNCGESPATFTFEYENRSIGKEMLLLLIKYGLDTSSLSSAKGINLLHTYLKFYVDNQVDLEIIGIILDAGVPINELDKYDNYSPLMRAVVKQNIELVSLLIERGANLNVKTPESMTPLWIATKCNDIKIVKLLLSKGAHINAKNCGGSTPLHTACENHNDKMIELLIRKGAELCVENNAGETPFSLLYFGENAVNIIMKELSIMSLANCNITENDRNLIKECPDLTELFETCQKELHRLSEKIFFKSYSYCSVLKMSRNMKKLAYLMRNVKFVQKFLDFLPCTFYDNNLRSIYEEAIKIRNSSLIVENRLKYIFDDFFPKVVIRELSKSLDCEDLPL